MLNFVLDIKLNSILWNFRWIWVEVTILSFATLCHNFNEYNIIHFDCTDNFQTKERRKTDKIKWRMPSNTVRHNAREVTFIESTKRHTIQLIFLWAIWLQFHCVFANIIDDGSDLDRWRVVHCDRWWHRAYVCCCHL